MAEIIVMAFWDLRCEMLPFTFLFFQGDRPLYKILQQKKKNHKHFVLLYGLGTVTWGYIINDLYS